MDTPLNAILNGMDTRCIDELGGTVIRKNSLDAIFNAAELIEIDPPKISYKTKLFDVTFFERLTGDIFFGFHLLRQLVKP